ncbi:hypothetical protein TNIN_104341 [Trichonephila inaurata madagascariensis]|uniref:Uncharacterized protein n=1 Tax=Trichonephila inaurata madagascariensis TaxID=2747483 RepID=A0A8X6YG12_9ARAC|nr:hypothetical protein TNIN_104341 [Trichonephila inaurata madagascariensis]
MENGVQPLTLGWANTWVSLEIFLAGDGLMERVVFMPLKSWIWDKIHWRKKKKTPRETNFWARTSSADDDCRNFPLPGNPGKPEGGQTNARVLGRGSFQGTVPFFYHPITLRMVRRRSNSLDTKEMC